ASAIEEFKVALQRNKHPADSVWTVNTELNIAYSLAEYGNTEEALRHLENARLFDSDNKQEAERAWTGAQIAYRRHDLAHASTLTDKYLQLRDAEAASGTESPAAVVDRDDRLDVMTLRARIELERGDLERAESWARCAVKQAELIREQQ